MSIITLSLGGRRFTRWQHVRITRDLATIAGGFEMQLFDGARVAASDPAYFEPLVESTAIQPGMACELSIDSEPVLVGWIDDVDPTWEDGSRHLRITGRDKVGDLVDCSPMPEGPAELRNISLLDLARRVCAPFGITVRAETDIGPPFDLVAVYPHETALSMLEKQARQRAVLVVSDGVGGLVLTRAGTRRAPSPLRIGELIQRGSLKNSWAKRFSETIVKGQTDHTSTTDPATMDHSVTPLVREPVSSPARPLQASRIIMQGRAAASAVTKAFCTLSGISDSDTQMRRLSASNTSVKRSPLPSRTV